MTWRVAKSLDALRDQVDILAPARSIISDGSIGDADHQTRTSDHNPWVPPPLGGVVTARDITHDPGHGASMYEISESLRLDRDPRIKYVIFSARMFSSYATSGYPAWTWRPYTGTNLHTAHMHISVQPTASLYDSTKKWDIDPEGGASMPLNKKDLVQIRAIVQEENDLQRILLAVGKDRKHYDPDKVNIARAAKGKGAGDE